MKKITKEEASCLLYKHKNRQNEVLIRVAAMAVGEYLKVDKEEWLPKSPPNMGVNNHGRGTGKKFIVKMLHDESGWVIERLK